MKKVLCLFLAAIMLMSMSTSAFAASSNNNELVSSGDIYIYEESDGIFRTAKSRNVTGAIRISPDEQFDNIYSATSQKQYYQKTNDDEFIQVSKVVSQYHRS